MLAVALEHDRAQTLRAAQRIERREQPVDHRAVIGVVHLGPVERNGRDAARVHVPENRALEVRRHELSRVIPDRAEGASPESITTNGAVSKGLWLWIPGSSLRSAPE